jgi:hypothetical protein
VRGPLTLSVRLPGRWKSWAPLTAASCPGCPVVLAVRFRARDGRRDLAEQDVASGNEKGVSPRG